MAVLAGVGGIGCKTVCWSYIALTSFMVRLAQRLAELEIRRVESDIRTVTPNLIHRITPRFKSLLHEAHRTGNNVHQIFSFFIPVVITNVLQIITGVFVANFDDQEEGLTKVCVPGWVFAAVFQPVLTLLIYVNGFGNLNLAIERDVDQEIVEMNIRLTYSDSHVPNWLLQQMICVERLDGRAYSLPFNIVPSVEMSRQLFSNAFAFIVFLAPYLVSIKGKLSSELMCPAERMFYSEEEIEENMFR